MQTTTQQSPEVDGVADWRDGALCRETDPDLFFPTATHGRRYAAQVAAAKAVCARCTVRTQCLAFALDALAVGIAGGRTEAERRRLRRHEQGAQRRTQPLRVQARELREQGISAVATAARFGVSTRTVERWVAHDREHGHAPDCARHVDEVEDSRAQQRADEDVERDARGPSGENEDEDNVEEDR